MSGILTVRDLTLRRGGRQVLHRVDLDVATREVVALMGLSGVGKTTVLRAIAGLDPADAGTVAVTATEQAPAGRLGFVFQSHCLFEHLSVLDNVCLALVHVHRLSKRQARDRAWQLLELLGIGHRARAFAREISGGEAQRAAIARALAADPPLLLLDEPTAALDPPRRASLGALLRQLASGDRAILLTSHDVEFVREHTSRVLILANGRIVESGTPSEVFRSPAHEATRELLRLEAPSRVPGFRGSEVPEL